MTLTLILTLTFGLLVWVDFFSSRSGSAGNETATCALLRSSCAYGNLGAVSTSWWMQSESARGESNTRVLF